MRAVVLDVGGHFGESLDVMLNPRFAFHEIHTFEPSAACVATLRKYKDPRLRVHDYGLGRADAEVTLYGSGLSAASLYEDKDVGEGRRVEKVRIRDAADWMDAHMRPSDAIYVKMNCEGAEVDIIERLHETGHLAWIDSLLLSLDSAKVPSLVQRGEELLDTLGGYPLQVQVRPTGSRVGVKDWLDDEAPRAHVGVRDALRWFWGTPLPSQRRVRRALILVTPRPVWKWGARRFGPTSKL